MHHDAFDPNVMPKHRCLATIAANVARRRRAWMVLVLLSAGAMGVMAPAGATVFCPILKSRDGFVALRTGPGANFPIVARMKEDDEVQLLEGRKGPWTEVRHWRASERLDEAKRDKFRRGWAHRRYIGDCG
jgi:hypothetical protein